MSNQFYNAARQDLPRAEYDLTAGGFKVTGVKPAYTFSLAHTQISDLGANVLTTLTAQTIGGVAVSTAGVVSGNSVTFTGVGASQTLQALVLYYDLGGGTTRLIAYYDTGTGFPLTTTGADITVDWNGTAGNGTIMSVV